MLALPTSDFSELWGDLNASSPVFPEHCIYSDTGSSKVILILDPEITTGQCLALK